MSSVEVHGISLGTVPLAPGVSDNVVNIFDLLKRVSPILKYSECKSVGGEDCIFPFKFKGKTYTSCTTTESVNGAAWCATKVDSDDNVVRNFWKDCEEGCPMGETNAFFHQIKSQMIIC